MVQLGRNLSIRLKSDRPNGCLKTIHSVHLKYRIELNHIELQIKTRLSSKEYSTLWFKDTRRNVYSEPENENLQI